MLQRSNNSSLCGKLISYGGQKRYTPFLLLLFFVFLVCFDFFFFFGGGLLFFCCCCCCFCFSSAACWMCVDKQHTVHRKAGKKCSHGRLTLKINDNNKIENVHSAYPVTTRTKRCTIVDSDRKHTHQTKIEADTTGQYLHSASSSQGSQSSRHTYRDNLSQQHAVTAHGQPISIIV